MFKRKISREEYLKDVFYVAKEVLLGAYLCSDVGGEFTAGKITELEVYVGAEDKASHAYLSKKTKRNAVMFENGGLAYVFFVYGMHNQFNVVAEPEGVANAVLIRSLEPVEGIGIMQKRRNSADIKNLTTGPGKLCQALGITRDHNAIDLTGNTLWISPKTQNIEIVSDKRIGINYAEEYKDKPWRFLTKGSSFVSKKIRG